MQWGKVERFGVVCLSVFWIFSACFVAEVLATEKRPKKTAKLFQQSLQTKSVSNATLMKQRTLRKQAAHIKPRWDVLIVIRAIRLRLWRV